VEEKKTDDVEKVLSDEILADARRRAERTVKRAEREGQKLIDRTLKKVEAVRKRVLRQTERRGERERHVFESGLTLEERMRRLRTQGQLLDEVFEKALERLRDRGSRDDRQVIRRLAVEAVLAMTGDAFVLRLAKDDLGEMKKGLPDEVAVAVRKQSDREVNVAVADRAAPIGGGVVVETSDGRQSFDNSFAGRLRRMKEELRFEVADVLLKAPDDREAPAKEDAS